MSGTVTWVIALIHISTLILAISTVLRIFNFCHIAMVDKLAAIGFSMLFMTSFVGIAYLIVFGLRGYL